MPERLNPVLACLCCLWVFALGCDDFRQGLPDSGGDATTDAGTPFTVIHAVPAGSDLLSVWGADPDHVFAVGSDNLQMEYTNGAWTTFTPSVAGQELNCVWGSAANDVYTAGAIQGSGQGIVQHFDGTGWHDEYIAATPLYAIWGDKTHIIAVGAQGEIYGKLVGTTSWAPVLSMGLPANPKVDAGPGAPDLWSVAGTSINDFAMAAGLDRVFVYDQDAGAFINLDPAIDRTLDFHSVFAVPGTSPTSYVFGTNYLGGVWLTSAGPPDASVVLDGMYALFQDRSSPGNETQYMYGVWGTATRFVFVGDQGRIATYDVVSNAATLVPSPVSDSLIGVWGSSLSDVWIVGQRELILHGSLE